MKSLSNYIKESINESVIRANVKLNVPTSINGADLLRMYKTKSTTDAIDDAVKSTDMFELLYVKIADVYSANSKSASFRYDKNRIDVLSKRIAANSRIDDIDEYDRLNRLKTLYASGTTQVYPLVVNSDLSILDGLHRFQIILNIYGTSSNDTIAVYKKK